MCLSAPASFLLGATLLPGGYYCTKIAYRHSKKHLLLAAVPLAFAAQQFCEGFVWIGVDHQNARLVSGASVVYLFFAIAFWPFWIPLSLMLANSRKWVIWTLAILVAISLAWGWLYAPILVNPDQWLSTGVVHHSIQYEYTRLPGYEVVSPWAWRIGYLALVTVPFGLGAMRLRRRSGGFLAAVGLGTLVAGFGVCYFVYSYAFISAWCFLAALISLALCCFFAKLRSAITGPNSKTNTSSSEPCVFSDQLAST
jgi:hypothetical protein